MKAVEKASDPVRGLFRTGESALHMGLKYLAGEYLVNNLKIVRGDVLYEYPFHGFEVDVIDRQGSYPFECGDTNAFKLEKYLEINSVKAFFVIPYPHSGVVSIYKFFAKPTFFDYLAFKKNYLIFRSTKNKKNR